jgi:hypothetical protein
MSKIGPFVLIGIDAEGEVRECNHTSLERAIAVARESSVSDENGPAWQCWEVWGNHPETDEWMPLASSADVPNKKEEV